MSPLMDIVYMKFSPAESFPPFHADQQTFTQHLHMCFDQKNQ